MKVTISYDFDPQWSSYGGYWAKALGEYATGSSFAEARTRLIAKLKEKKLASSLTIPEPEEVEI